MSALTLSEMSPKTSVWSFSEAFFLRKIMIKVISDKVTIFLMIKKKADVTTYRGGEWRRKRGCSATWLLMSEQGKAQDICGWRPRLGPAWAHTGMAMRERGESAPGAVAFRLSSTSAECKPWYSYTHMLSSSLCVWLEEMQCSKHAGVCLKTPKVLGKSSSIREHSPSKYQLTKPQYMAA